MESASVQNDKPSNGISLRRNSPVSDSAGDPSPAGSLTSGVVSRKLIVARNNTIVIKLPMMERTVEISTISPTLRSCGN
jgi:hypothetical protein